MKMTILNNKKVMYGSAVLLVGLAGYVIWNKQQKKKDIKYINDVLDGSVADPTTGGAQKIITKSEASALPDGTFPIKFGQKNKKVLALQQALNRKYQSGIDQDGKFGISTANSICKNYLTFCKSGLSDTATIKLAGSISNEDYNKIIK